MVGPARKREAVAHVCQRQEASERRACRAPGQIQAPPPAPLSGRPDAHRVRGRLPEPTGLFTGSVRLRRVSDPFSAPGACEQPSQSEA